MKRAAVFAKRPEPGRVKTRLSPALPAGLACDLYRGMLEDALDVAAAAGADELFLYWADAGPGSPAPEAASRFRPRVQRGADLGERLANAFAELLAPPEARAVVIGADCPGLEAETIREAFDALETAAVAIGPAGDGGYCLIGLRRTAPELFRDIPWSTARVRSATLERAASLGLGVRSLAPLEDLDTPEDLLRWVASAASRRTTPGPRTLAALRAIGLLPPAADPS